LAPPLSEEMMARLIYACSFEIASAAGLGSILMAYSSWIVEHYRERRGLKDFTLELKGDGQISAPLSPVT
jgi:hypothetical protein